MKLFDFAYLLRNDIKFSLREVEKSILLITAGVIAIVIVAVVTFEGEYFTGLTLEIHFIISRYMGGWKL